MTLFEARDAYLSAGNCLSPRDYRAFPDRAICSKHHHHLVGRFIASDIFVYWMFNFYVLECLQIALLAPVV